MPYIFLCDTLLLFSAFVFFTATDLTIESKKRQITVQTRKEAMLDEHLAEGLNK